MAQTLAYDAAVIDVPPPLLEHAQAWVRDPGTPVTPRDAATVILLRDRVGGLEVYLLRRVSTMAFAAGMHVFPGGSVDPRDRGPGLAWAGPPVADWAGRLACDEDLARALVCAAVREAFEESGVLLAGPSADAVVGDTTPDDWEADRLALLDRTLSMAELLERRGLVLRSDLLGPWAHWVTPEFEPRRFDTRFLVAALPEGQRPRDVSTEAEHATWVPVRTAAAEYEAGRMAMLPPTVAVLRELAEHPDVASVLATEREVRTVMPRLVVVDGRMGMVIE